MACCQGVAKEMPVTPAQVKPNWCHTWPYRDPSHRGLLGLCAHVSCYAINPSLREPGGPCTKSMEVSESRMEQVNYFYVF